MRRNERKYNTPLSEDDWMITRIIKNRGHVIEFSVMQYTRIDGTDHEITRFDNAHSSIPHQHVLFSSDPNRILNFPSMTANEALTFAQNYIKRDFAKLREIFRNNRERI